MLCDRRPVYAALSLILSGLVVAPSWAQGTPSQPSAAQPTLPAPLPGPNAPVVEQIMRQEQPPLVVRKQVNRPVPQRRRIARHRRVPRELDRPALAGVELVAPLPPPGEPPHISVPLPAYSLDSLAAAYLTPPPPIVCHRTRRDRSAPDPHLYKEVPVDCEPDNP